MTCRHCPGRIQCVVTTDYNDDDGTFSGYSIQYRCENVNCPHRRTIPEGFPNDFESFWESLLQERLDQS